MTELLNSGAPSRVLLTRADLIQITGYSRPTFKRWAKRGKGPHVTIIEGRPRYLVADVEAWLRGAGNA